MTLPPAPEGPGGPVTPGPAPPHAGGLQPGPHPPDAGPQPGPFPPHGGGTPEGLRAQAGRGDRWRWLARLTLRTRLLLVLVGILAAGLVASDLVTFTELRNYLVGQVDTQLQSVPVNSVADTVYRCSIQAATEGTTGCTSVPTDVAASLGRGTLAQLVIPGGRTLSLWIRPAPAPPAPVLPRSLPAGPFTAHAGDGTPYRLLVQVLPTTGSGVRGPQFVFVPGTLLVVAVPLSGVDHDLAHLAAIEVLVSVVALVGLGALSWWVVRRGLRPLREMTGTARAIAAGDLSRRVEHTEEATEVGQLGQALNTMLGEIEQAFAARAASEERLRRFLADASHELRTPLTSIRGYAEMFDRGVRDRPEDLAVAMGHIRSEADRMGVLVEDLLLLARLDQQRPLAMEPVDLAGVVQEAASAARAAHPGRHVSAATPEHAPVLGDAVRLRQVVDNLVANAIVYSPPDGPVDVAVTCGPTGTEVTVADRGPGIAPEDRRRIFEPFQRLDPSRTRATGGVGLGLAIVAAIVRAHGGAVSVEERPGGGSLFRVSLAPAGAPASSGDAGAAPTAVPPEPVRSAGPEPSGPHARNGNGTSPAAPPPGPPLQHAPTPGGADDPAGARPGAGDQA